MAFENPCKQVSSFVLYHKEKGGVKSFPQEKGVKQEAENKDQTGEAKELFMRKRCKPGLEKAKTGCKRRRRISCKAERDPEVGNRKKARVMTTEV